MEGRADVYGSNTAVLDYRPVSTVAADCEDARTYRGSDAMNPFVSHLSRYTTASPDHEAAFDEYISESEDAERYPLVVRTRVEGYLRDRLKGPQQPSIVLTGNAGDGKTYLCRSILSAYGHTPGSQMQGVTRLDIGGTSLTVVKDLSELGSEAGTQVLRDVSAAVSHRGCGEAYLVAANEGRLRDLLTAADLDAFRTRVDAQLTDPDYGSEDLVVVDLNRSTPSEYVRHILAQWTSDARWEACYTCPAVTSCPIHANVGQLRKEVVRDRVRQLYIVLEHLDIHATFRDTLMHLAYTITGALTCERVVDVATGGDPSHDLHKYLYHENVTGVHAEAGLGARSTALSSLRPLNLGDYSSYEIDRELIYAESASSDAASVTNVAEEIMSGSGFPNAGVLAQRRSEYLNGAVGHEEESTSLIEWLPFCRRRLYFLCPDASRVNGLFAFRYLSDYLRLIEQNSPSLLEVHKQYIIGGLNRAFSGLYLAEGLNTHLYLTVHFAHAAERPMPIVRHRIPADKPYTELTVVSAADDSAVDSSRRTLQFNASVHGSAPVTVDINLVRYEYLRRLAAGGTHNVLARSCRLFIRDVRDRLLSGAFPVGIGLQYLHETSDGYGSRTISIADGSVSVS
jgi:hypothetical protein